MFSRWAQRLTLLSALQVWAGDTVSICRVCGPGGRRLNRSPAHICLQVSDLPRPPPPWLDWVGGINLGAAHTCIKTHEFSIGRGQHSVNILPLLLTCHGFLNGSTNSPPGTHGKEKGSRREGNKKKGGKKKSGTGASSAPVVIFTSLYDSI